MLKVKKLELGLSEINSDNFDESKFLNDLNRTITFNYVLRSSIFTLR